MRGFATVTSTVPEVSNPSEAWPTAKTGVAAGLIATAFLLSPVTSNVMAAPPSLVSHFASPIGQSTSGMVSVAETTPRGGSATARSVQDLHARSGLTWGQLAEALGVTRRTVHNWAAGTTLNSHNAAVLSRVTQVVAELEQGDPNLTRSALLAPDPGGKTALQTLVSAARRSGRDVGSDAPTLSIAQLLISHEDGPGLGPVLEVGRID